MNLKQCIRQNILNITGWCTKRKLIIIESDDWGSIRMPSIGIYNKLIRHNVKLGKYGYEKYDSIASKKDLELLFDLCTTFRDIHDNPIIITANTVIGNPDFQKIAKSNFQEYYWESMVDTMEKYYGCDSPFATWKKGIDNKLFYPQLHGREHVNVSLWLKSLRANYPGARLAFENGVFSIVVNKEFDHRCKNTTALRYESEIEFEFVKQSIYDASKMFEKIFGYKSKSFIAPSFSWDRRIEYILRDIGVYYLQGMPFHFYNGKRTLNYIGRKNSLGQIYLNRNVEFEPSLNPNIDNVDKALSQIEIAFRWYKPATISIHRLNFIGSVNEKNRDENLKLFKKLFTLVLRKWPDVEFLTSDQLGNLIALK